LPTAEPITRAAEVIVDDSPGARDSSSLPDCGVLLGMATSGILPPTAGVCTLRGAKRA
jgi:hypothetical protein